jgi:hypothetical protein
MTKFLTLVLCAGMAMAASAASDDANKTATRKPSPAMTAAQVKAEAAKAKQLPDPMLDKLPAGAKMLSPGEWEYTDSQGKKWIYRRTPFTLAKLAAAENPETAGETESDRAILESTTAVETGDSIQFRRPGLFGMLKWTAKKSQLDAFERRVWEREQRKTAQPSSTTAAPTAAAATTINQE